MERFIGATTQHLSLFGADETVALFFVWDAVFLLYRTERKKQLKTQKISGWKKRLWAGVFIYLFGKAPFNENQEDVYPEGGVSSELGF